MINTIYSITHKQWLISVFNHNSNILTSNANLNIINTTNTNLVTVVTSSDTKPLYDNSTLPHHFTSFTN